MAPRFYLDAPLRAGSVCTLSEDAAHHAIHVLRLREGEDVTLFNGRGGEYAARIASIQRLRIAIDLLEHRQVERESPLRVKMKMWPFDEYAYASGGTHIAAADLDKGMQPFRQVRQAAGARMDLMVELHGLWNLPTALRIARAFEAEGLEPYWIEDPLRPDDLGSLARFAGGTRLPTTASELLAGRQAFRELLEARAASIVMLDLGWCGGLSEGKAIASMA